MKSLVYLAFFSTLLGATAGFAKQVILDVRTAEEYNQGHIPSALHLDVLKEDKFRTDVIKLDRNDDYKVYCRGGKRAAQAISIMQTLGFNHLENLGGYEDAKKALAKTPATSP